MAALLTERPAEPSAFLGRRLQAQQSCVRDFRAFNVNYHLFTSARPQCEPEEGDEVCALVCVRRAVWCGARVLDCVVPQATLTVTEKDGNDALVLELP